MSIKGMKLRRCPTCSQMRLMRGRSRSPCAGCRRTRRANATPRREPEKRVGRRPTAREIEELRRRHEESERLIRAAGFSPATCPYGNPNENTPARVLAQAGLESGFWWELD